MHYIIVLDSRVLLPHRRTGAYCSVCDYDRSRAAVLVLGFRENIQIICVSVKFKHQCRHMAHAEIFEYNDTQ